MGVLAKLVSEARVRFYRAERPDLYYSRARIRRAGCGRSIHRPESQFPDGQYRGQLQVRLLPLLTFTSLGVSSWAGRGRGNETIAAVIHVALSTPQQLRQLRNVRRDPPRLVTNLSVHILIPVSISPPVMDGI